MTGTLKNCLGIANSVSDQQLIITKTCMPTSVNHSPNRGYKRYSPLPLTWKKKEKKITYSTANLV